MDYQNMNIEGIEQNDISLLVFATSIDGLRELVVNPIVEPSEDMLRYTVSAVLTRYGLIHKFIEDPKEGALMREAILDLFSVFKMMDLMVGLGAARTKQFNEVTAHSTQLMQEMEKTGVDINSMRMNLVKLASDALSDMILEDLSDIANIEEFKKKEASKPTVKWAEEVDADQADALKQSLKDEGIELEEGGFFISFDNKEVE